jgi:transcription-repair coupling factor (superfamily II helicase)
VTNLEEIREFSVADQRSLVSERTIETTVLYAAREVIITPFVASRAREMQHEFMNISTMLAKIAKGIPVDGMEALAPVLVESLVPFSSFMPQGSGVILVQPERSAARAHDLIATNQEFLHAAWEAATNGADAPIDIAAGGFMQVGEFMANLAQTPVATISPFAAQEDTAVDLKLHEMPNFRALDANPVDYIADQLANGQLVVLATEGHGTAERIAELLAAAKVNAEVVEALPAKFAPKTAYLLQASLRQGFSSPDANLIVMTESEFYGRTRLMLARRGATGSPSQNRCRRPAVH